MTPDYLLSDCIPKTDLCRGCSQSTKQNPETKRWYITMGHPGFNSPANNRNGYQSQAHAQCAVYRYAQKGR